MLKSNNEETKHFYDSLISDFTDPLFLKAFQKYFAEFGIEVKDWDGVFAEMNNEGDNESFVRKTKYMPFCAKRGNNRRIG